MPENETLTDDPRKARRFRPLADRLERGESPPEVFVDIQKNFYKMIGNISKQWKKCGVQPEQLFEAAVRDREKFGQLLRQTRNDSTARVLKDAAAGESSANRQTVIRNFIDLAWERVRAQLRVDCLPVDKREDILQRARPMLDRLAADLERDPSRMPRCPRRVGPSPNIDDILGESLLGN